MTSNLRFSSKSPCDCFIFDGDVLFPLELKSVSGKSISFERTENDKGVIHKHQIDYLSDASHFKNVIPGFILDFRSSEKTYFYFIGDFQNMINHITKKSFNEVDMEKYGQPILVDKRKLKVNYRYDINKLLDDIKSKRIKGEDL